MSGTLILSGWTQPVDALAHVVDNPVLFDYSDYENAEAAIEDAEAELTAALRIVGLARKSLAKKRLA
jgi:hypothetical protein